MIYLPDTNIWSSYLRGRREDTALRTKLEAVAAGCLLSAVVLFELEYGAAKRPDVPVFRQRVESLRHLFPDVVAFDDDAAFHAGAVRAALARLRPNAQPVGPYDVLLAGQAIALGAVLVTRNTREFSRVAGLRLESWT